MVISGHDKTSENLVCVLHSSFSLKIIMTAKQNQINTNYVFIYMFGTQYLCLYEKLQNLTITDQNNNFTN